MKPVLVLQHLSADGPAYLATWLHRQGVPFEVRNAEAGQPYPDDLAAYSAMALLGGEWSANDARDSLRQAEALILQGVRRGLPVVGHCLGAQLMARALGARVLEAPAPEIGWHSIEVLPGRAAAHWLGNPGPRRVFQWHYETFELPAGAERLASSVACPNQAFAVGPHIALQFHVEVDAEKLGRWVLEDSDRYHEARARHATVQSAAAMLRDAEASLAAQQALADRLYARWLGAPGA
jgi:GMP synthase-like glutamine amidotransferase